MRFTPSNPLSGMNLHYHKSYSSYWTWFFLNPKCFKYGISWFRISSNRSLFQRASSILFTRIPNVSTPFPRKISKWSFVIPAGLIPASNSPFAADTTRRPQSAWIPPVIILLMKSRWPGASRRVTVWCGRCNVETPKSIVTPCSL